MDDQEEEDLGLNETLNYSQVSRNQNRAEEDVFDIDNDTNELSQYQGREQDFDHQMDFISENDTCPSSKLAPALSQIGNLD